MDVKDSIEAGTMNDRLRGATPLDHEDAFDIEITALVIIFLVAGELKGEVEP